MKTLDPSETGIKEISNFLTSSVVPRPIAFVSTVDENGAPNLSPFSFFNAFSSVPPVLVFSPAKSALTGKQKDTYHNVMAMKECVIHIPNFAMVEQLSVTSGAYPEGVNEFLKGGLTEVPSVKVKPPRVQEAPVAFECKVLDVIALGDKGGAGNLVICEIVLVHFDETLADERGNMIPEKLDAVSRLGYNYYARITRDVIFETPKPLKAYGIGVDAIPQWIKDENELNGNELGKLASISSLPLKTEIDDNPELKKLLSLNKKTTVQHIQSLLSENRVNDAWLVMLNAE
jgi:flavin reductase (DIM6/NTAB) family NADH-FMN oxidoreductase RutF